LVIGLRSDTAPALPVFVPHGGRLQLALADQAASQGPALRHAHALRADVLTVDEEPSELPCGELGVIGAEEDGVVFER